MSSQRAIGLAVIALGIGFNIPYAILASTYDYPQILRQPAEIALEKFAEGGPVLILTWYAFMLSALALIPVAAGLAFANQRLARQPALAVSAAVMGALAGLLQAIGLARWVFVIPSIAAAPADPDGIRAFELLNAYGGVAIGEHLGQFLTALFVIATAAIQQAEGQRPLSVAGYASAVLIAIGTGEGLAIALGADGEPFSLATIGGFLGLGLWLIGSGWTLARPSSRATPVPA